MSYVVALPEVMSAAATDVASIGSVVATASQGVAGATTTVLAAAEDEVSAAIAALFSAHGQDYQALSAQLAVFHERFVQALTGAAKGHAAAELANASLLQSEFASGIGNGFATIHQEIQRAPRRWPPDSRRFRLSRRRRQGSSPARRQGLPDSTSLRCGR